MAVLTPRQRANFESMSSPEPNTGCWIWTGYVNQWGYGHFNLLGKIEKAHRVSYQDAFGRIPDGYLVLHKCDQPACVNPDHLRVGTDSENGADKAKRQRAPTKLSDSDVRAVHSAPGKYRDIAEQFNISPAWVCRIKVGGARIHARKSS